MRSRRMVRGLIVFAVLGALYGVADAQTATGRRTDMAADAQRQAQLSPQQQVEQGKVVVAKIAVAAATTRRMLEQARAQRDVVKTLCLNDKLNQLDVASRSASERQAALEAAAGKNDGALANHEFIILTVLKQRAEQISSESNQCVGQETEFWGKTEVSTTTDPGLPKEDPSKHPDVEFISLPPVCVSCTY
jgi:hypothetical protein